MPGLNVHADHENSAPTSKKKWNRGPKVILAVSLLLLIPVIGTSLASNVVVNGGGPITFGQGYQAALACDDSVTITPQVHTTYDGTVYWYIYMLAIAIDTTPTNVSGVGCGGKTITIQALNHGVVVGTAVSFTLASADPWNATVITNATTFDSAGSTSDTIDVPVPSEILATDVDGFTIQQS